MHSNSIYSWITQEISFFLVYLLGICLLAKGRQAICTGFFFFFSRMTRLTLPCPPLTLPYPNLTLSCIIACRFIERDAAWQATSNLQYRCDTMGCSGVGVSQGLSGEHGARVEFVMWSQPWLKIEIIMKLAGSF